MKKKIYAAVFLILLSLGIFSFYRIEPLRLEICFSVSINVPPENVNNYNGSCSIRTDNLNFSVPKNPSFSRDNIEITKESYYQDEFRETPVHFQLLLTLNDIQKVIEIGNLQRISSYEGVGNCYFDGITSGSYNLTITSIVNGVIDKNSDVEIALAVP